MNNILSYIIALFIFLICAYNGQKLIAQADGDTGYSYIIAISVALLFTLLFREGKKRFHNSQPNGLIFMLVVVLFEIGMGLFLTTNISKHEIKGVSKPFAPDSLQISQVFNARIDSFRATIAKQGYNNRAYLSKLKPNQTTEKAATRQKIDKFSLDSSEKVAAINSRFLLSLKDKKEQLDAQNELGIGDALDTKKAANNAIAFANVILYFFFSLLSKKEDLHEKEFSILNLIKSKLYRQSNLLSEINTLKSEVSRLTPFEAQAENFRLKVEISRNELEESRKQLDASRNEVEINSKKSVITFNSLEVANKKLISFTDSLQIYLNAPFTINNSELLYLYIDAEGVVQHKKIGKSGHKNIEGLEMLNKKLGYASEPKPKTDTSKVIPFIQKHA